jgi:acetyl esterase/lipase
MKRLIPTSVCLTTLFACVSLTLGQTPTRSIRDLVNMPVVYRVAGMDNVVIRSNLKYSDVDNPNLLLDVYIPNALAKSERRPAVVFIHGSAGAEARAKNWGFYVSWGRLIAASGLVGVTFTHRLGYPKPLLQESVSDVNTAISYIRANSGSLNIDKDRICLAAYSGGGPLLSIGMGQQPYIRCLVSFYAFLDVQQSQLHRDNETAETLRTMSPINYLRREGTAPAAAVPIPPMFIARAGLDAIPTLNDSIDRFIAEALKYNAPIVVANHPRGVHGFDSQNDDNRSREIIRSAIDFMKTHLE